MKNRMITLLLTLAMLLPLFPTAAWAAGGGPTIVINDLHLVEDGKAISNEIPSGVSYSERTQILTLNGASLGPVHIYGGGELTVVLKEHSTVRNDGSFRMEDGSLQIPFTVDETTVTIKGPGSLEVDSSGTDIFRTFVVDYADVSITEGAAVTVRNVFEGAHGTFEVVSGGLTVDGGAVLNVYGLGGLSLRGNASRQSASVHRFADCAITANRLVVDASLSAAAPWVMVEAGAKINLISTPTDEFGRAGSVFRVGGGSQFILDGGEITIDTAATPEGQGACFGVTGDGSLFELRSGTLNAVVTGAHGVGVTEGGTLLQSGGTLTVETSGNCPALGIRNGSEVILKGGSASFTGKWGISLDAGILTVNGGYAKIMGTGGDGLSVQADGNLSVLGGTVSIESCIPQSVPLMCALGGHINLFGGTVHLYKEGSAAVMTASGDNPVIIGGGMHAVNDDTGEEIELDVSGETRYLGSSVTISGEKSCGDYSCDLSIPSGKVTQGAKFTVRAVVSLGAKEGQATFSLPAGVTYVPGSLTVDSKAVSEMSANPLTVSLQDGGVIRFSAIANITGDQTLTANIMADGERHQETLDFAVHSFDLSLPNRTSRIKLPVSGTAIPGSAIAFYEGDSVLGNAKSNALGTWSGTVTLPEVAGDHTVYAIVTFPDGGSFCSDNHVIAYEPETDEVKTLTVSNYVHGRTTADPPVESSLVIDYATGNDSADYYAFWADLPTLAFRVDFVKDSSAQSRVAVITTDRLGKETRIPLRYKAVEDAWTGSYDFDESSVPYKFRVEFLPGEAGLNQDGAEYIYADKNNTVLVEENGQFSTVEYEGVGTFKITYSDGTVSRQIYDEQGRMIRATDGETSISYSYDPCTAIVSDSSGEIAIFDFDDAGNLSGMESPDGTAINYSYDESGNLTQITLGAYVIDFCYEPYEVTVNDGAGTVICTLSDASDGGNMIRMVRPDGSAFVFTCGSSGNITSISDCDGIIRYAYDDSGALTGITDANGNTTEYKRDDPSGGTVIRYPDGKIEHYSYDAENHLNRYTNRAGDETKYSYDSSGNLIKAIYENGESVYYTYDADQNLTSINENGQITSLEYNAGGDVTKIVYPDGRSVIYSYDAQGRQTSVFDGTYTTGYTYNDLDQILTVSDGTSILITYTYDADGFLAKQQNANGTYTDFTYDEEGILTSIQNYDAADTLISSFAYVNNDLGLISAMTEASGTWRYRYDGKDQLIESVSPSGEITQYAYDAAGNRTQVTVNGQITSYTANAMNQYAVYGAASRTYDANGNLLTETKDGRTARYSWDIRGRLVRYTDFDGTVYEYGYDAFGLRNRVTVNGVTTSYLNDPTGCGYTVASYQDGCETHYAVSDGIAAAWIDGITYFYNADHLGSVTEITGADGTVVNRYTYDQEGSVLSKTEGIVNHYSYMGIYGIVSDGNGLIYDRARYISAATDSFISMDPSGQDADIHVYRLLENNAVNMIDLDGNRARGAIRRIPGQYNARIQKGRVNRYGNRAYSQGAMPRATPKVSPAPVHVQPNPPILNPARKFPFKIDPKQIAFDIGWGIGEYIVEKWPDNPLTNGAAWVGEQISKTPVGPVIYYWIGEGSPFQDLADLLAPLFEFIDCIEDPVRYFLTSPIKIWKEKRKHPEWSSTQNKPIIVIEDPSGHVYEGFESNRLSGVTATLYYSDSKTKPIANATEAQKWDASKFEQSNPLTTDVLGQYLWMVPDGWWQVKYEKAGYETAYSDWLPVPPVQTDVNVGLVSKTAAKLTLSGEAGDDFAVLRFDRPVRLNSVTVQRVQISCGGITLAGALVPVDPAAAADGEFCATTFRFKLANGQTFKDGDVLSACFEDVMTYAGTASAGSVSVTVVDLMPFTDVRTTDYFYDAVFWAVNHAPQITNGTDGTSFTPDAGCTRSQAVTFLWRAMGKPEPKSALNPFTDVKEGAYYYKAVLWAVENGITNGTSATAFSPDALCTRGQIVTFLHRTEKTQAPTDQTNPFTDVDAAAYYHDAVLWAVEWGITKGAGSTAFSPDAICTRGQIVTFLYRDMAK